MKQNNFYRGRLLLFLFLLPCFVFAQNTISGKVTDESGQTVPFANVIVKGTTVGTTTDIDGNYSIDVPSIPTTLVFSSLGFATWEETVTVLGVTNITLKESAQALDEVVITGLGTSIKRENAANAVSSVSAEELVGTTAQATVDGALYGKVTGVNITSSSGAPGGGFALRLRGVSSINGNNQPLIIVDGVYYNNVEIPSGLRFASGANAGNEENSGNRLADLDPNDIEDIEILKGSSAAAIYGQRGNAGVIIITTKKGKRGKTKVSFSQDTGINTIQNRLGNRPWTRESVQEVFGTDERIKYENTINSRGELYDFEDIIYGNDGFITETRVSVTGGNEKTKFYTGVGYRDEEGIIKNTGFERLSLRANIDHTISETFSFSSNSNYVRSSSSRSFTGNENEGGLSYGYTLAFTRPWNDLFPDAQGNYPNNPNYPGNPIFVRDNAKNEDDNNRFVQGLSLTTKLLNTDKNRIKLITSGGIDYLSNETYVYVPETHQAQINGQEGFIGVGKNNFTQFNSQAIFVWNHDALDNDLGITSQAGLTYLYQDADAVLSTGAQLAAGQTNVSNSVNQTIRQTLREEQDFGYFGQVEGNYRDQIIATVGYRLDQSTRNGDPNELYGFPKASLALNLANFDFWNLDALNQFKLRGAYGETGNPAGFGATFTSLTTANIGGDIGQSLLGAKGDPDIEPETARELEVGLDVGLFNSRISLEATYYKKQVDDLILTRALPAASGFTQETTNLADLENKGIELALTADVIRGERFSWNTRVQFYKNQSEVTRLDVPAFAQPGAGFGTGLGTFFIEEGKPVTQLVGNIDGELTQVGDVEPDFQMAMSNTLTLFRQFDLSFLFQLKEGGENLNLSKFLTDLGQTTPDLETPEGQARLETPANAARFVEPAGYLKLREAALYYRVPSKFVDRVFGDNVESVKLGASGRNIFTVTDYSSYDPEVSVNGGAGLSSGIEVTPFPSSRQVYFHLNVNF
ncbi:SusC/RagA family TonB-linked outer membrane protein [Marinirhabdus gelatinilytica]|uniref:TonB-linked SusC/RagA family outer membrane protein n=1 Tax=Marinirhabdus gelatinilytica TaxID=1703343 RepID=A0A370QIU7_9FLAO|nr:SusC/RagA family TonB-linked outer membrane protein [Marinirhabdus gelatinilytica]RDK88293.1 TonB-linked SusC/RagA family outer membrane protein [Marinirhabdus gelatinilytica]